ncbi:VOC family protein [Paenibacillus sp. S-38]|uniref:VOC family protein n=1 Tax=Paenibacillus sp. S-38 TaxID=3416710 RepID=UPI003CEC353B
MLHHIELYVSDLAKSEAFWGWLLHRLGYSEYRRWEQGFSFRRDQTYLVFVQAEERFMDPPYHRCRVGLNHLAFHAGSKEHVDELTVELLRRGTPLLYPDRHPYAGGPGHYAVFFEDPDRIKVEVVAPPAFRDDEGS